jgi:hypothetical protein
MDGSEREKKGILTAKECEEGERLDGSVFMTRRRSPTSANGKTGCVIGGEGGRDQPENPKNGWNRSPIRRKQEVQNER